MGIIRGRSRPEPGETEWQKRGTGGPPVHASSFYTLVKHVATDPKTAEPAVPH